MPSNIEMKIVSPAYIGAMVNSAIYLASVFTAGLVTHNHWAWQAAIVAMGVTYLSYIANLEAAWERIPIAISHAITVISIILGTFAGLMLLY